VSKNNTLAKPLTIGGFVLGEIYMLFTALAPITRGLNLPLDLAIQLGNPTLGLPIQSVPVPLSVAVERVLALSFFFGPFGAAAGLGVWLVLISLRGAYRSLTGAAKPAVEPQAE
jgi:hypothetical protein